MIKRDVVEQIGILRVKDDLVKLDRIVWNKQVRIEQVYVERDFYSVRLNRVSLDKMSRC